MSDDMDREAVTKALTRLGSTLKANGYYKGNDEAKALIAALHEAGAADVVARFEADYACMFKNPDPEAQYLWGLWQDCRRWIEQQESADLVPVEVVENPPSPPGTPPERGGVLLATEVVWPPVEALSVLKVLSPDEAREICGQIRQCLGVVRNLLLALYEGEGWAALGHKNWRECVTTEFHQSQRHCYQLLAAAQVGRNLCAIAQIEADDIPESHLRSLADLEPEQQVAAYQLALDFAGSGRLTAKEIKRAAAQLQGKHPGGVAAGSDGSTDEHYTPEKYWRPALDGFGRERFDIDTATYARCPIPARVQLTKYHDALAQDMTEIAAENGGPLFAWGNWPYSLNEAFSLWFENALTDGAICHAFVLEKTDNGTAWYQRLLGHCSAYCLIDHRVCHESPSGAKRHGSFFGSTLFYFGDRPELFFDAYCHLGPICQVTDAEWYGFSEAHPQPV